MPWNGRRRIGRSGICSKLHPSSVKNAPTACSARSGERVSPRRAQGNSSRPVQPVGMPLAFTRRRFLFVRSASSSVATVRRRRPGARPVPPCARAQTKARCAHPRSARPTGPTPSGKWIGFRPAAFVMISRVQCSVVAGLLRRIVSSARTSFFNTASNNCRHLLGFKLQPVGLRRLSEVDYLNKGCPVAVDRDALATPEVVDVIQFDLGIAPRIRAAQETLESSASSHCLPHHYCHSALYLTTESTSFTGRRRFQLTGCHKVTIRKAKANFKKRKRCLTARATCDSLNTIRQTTTV